MTTKIDEFWNKMKDINKDEYKKIMEYLFEEYGTKLYCNRFGIGNCHEYAICDLISKLGLKSTVHQNATRIDICVEDIDKFSIKYSSGGNIKLHNSNNCSNTDLSMVNTLLVTPTMWWFLIPTEIEKLGIVLNAYIKNTGDGLELMKSLLTILKDKEYKYMFEYSININKKNCKNKEINRIIYDSIKEKIQSTYHSSENVQ